MGLNLKSGVSLEKINDIINNNAIDELSMGTARRNGKKWQAQTSYYDLNGKQQFITKGLPLYHPKAIGLPKGAKRTYKTEATAAAISWVNDLRNDCRVVRGLSIEENISTRDYVENYIKVKYASGIEASTTNRYLYCLKHLDKTSIGATPLIELKRQDVQNWVNKLNTKYAYATIKKSLGLLKAACDTAVVNNELTRTPCINIDLPKNVKTEPKALDEPMINKLGAVITDRLNEEQNQVTPLTLGIILGLNCGMRSGETCGLRWVDIDLENEEIHINKAIADGGKTRGFYVKEPKSKRSRRTLYMDSLVKETLTKRLYDVKQTALKFGVPFNEYWFILGDIEGNFYNNKVLNNQFKRLAKKHNITSNKRNDKGEYELPTYHTLRHTFATQKILSGVDIKTVSDCLGHADVAMTLNVYASANEQAKKNAMSSGLINQDSTQADVIPLKTGTND